MKKKIIALLLSAAMVFSIGAISVLAGTEDAEKPESAGTEGAAEAEQAVTEAAAEPEKSAETEQAVTEAADEPAESPETEQEEAPSLAGPDAAEPPEPDAIDQPVNERAEYNAEKLQKLINSVTVTPVTRESVSFGELEGLMRENNLSILGYEEYIKATQETDFSRMERMLDASLDSFSGLSFAMLDAMGTYATTQMSALYTQYDKLRNGTLQRDNASLARQMRYAQDMTVMGGETLYIALVGMEDQKASLERQLSALDRTVEEMELRYKLGQISTLQLSEVKTGRASLISGIETLEMNIRTYKMQLENLLGATLTGDIRLSGLPAVTEEQINAMNADRDFETARSRSYQILAAGLQLEKDRDAFNTNGAALGYDDWNAQYLQVRSKWKADQNTYNTTIQSYELKFRTLYEQVRDYYQVWKASQVSLANEKKSYEAAKLKYEQGNISHNALLTALDKVSAAEESVLTNANNLFSSYNTYCWAVERGIVN